jgi:hypothetical protein
MTGGTVGLILEMPYDMHKWALSVLKIENLVEWRLKFCIED